MNWKFFGYGVIVCCCLAICFKYFYHPKNEVKSEIVQDDFLEDKEEKISEYVSTSYGRMSENYRSYFFGTMVIEDKGVYLTGTQENIDSFKVLLEYIDVPPVEYIIDVLLLSIDTSETMQSGLGLLIDTLSNLDDNLNLSLAQTGNLTMQVGISQIVASLDKSTAKISIEGRSQIAVMEKHPALIKSGERRAIISDTQTDGVSIRSSYNYQDIGLMLSVGILSSSKDDVTLSIKQQADNVTGYSLISGDAIPVISQRQLQTAVRINLGETIILGGLTQENILQRNFEFPLLSKLPVIGNIFKNTSSEKVKSDLIIILSPVVPRVERKARLDKTYADYLKIK